MIRVPVNPVLSQIFFYMRWFPHWRHSRMWEVAELWRMYEPVDTRPDVPRGSR